jgi:hypothetical protein
MSFDEHANLSTSTIQIPPSPADSGTTLTVNAGDGATMPSSDPFNCTVWSAGQQATRFNSEIVRMTAVGRTTVAAGSNAAVLPQATIHVASSSNFDSGGGTCGIVTTDGVVQVITYTGKGTGTLTGCTGGTGTMHTGDHVVSDDFTIVRSTEAGENGIVFARSILKGDQIEPTITKKTLTDIEAGGGGGGTSNLGLFSVEVAIGDGHIFDAFINDTFIIGTSTDRPSAEYRKFYTTTPIVVGSGGVVFQGNVGTVTQIPTDADNYDGQQSVVVTNMTGTQIMSGYTTTTTTPGDNSLDIPWALNSATLTQVVGTDLTWDDTDGQIKSTAGGIFVVSVLFILNWD